MPGVKRDGQCVFDGPNFCRLQKTSLHLSRGWDGPAGAIDYNINKDLEGLSPLQAPWL